MEYVNPDALVETDWLAAHLDQPDVCVIDVSYHPPHAGKDARGEFRERHIPGAVYFDIDAIADVASPLPHMLPDAQTFARHVSELGIGSDCFVVAYDSQGAVSATRAWWMFRVFGHDRVAVLNGGLPKWQREERPLDSGESIPERRPFMPRYRPELVRSFEQMRANLDTAAEEVIDARSRDRYCGRVLETWPGLTVGHIPGSLNLPFGLLYGADDTFLDADKLAFRFQEAEVTWQKPVVATCGSGITACVLAFAAYLLGQESVAVYDGSWTEWGIPGAAPVETACEEDG